MTDTAPSKYLLVSKEIEDRIRGGAWPDGRIPSVRNLAVSHGVSVVTASRALQVLRDRGLISTVNRGGCFLARKAAANGRFALILRTTPGPYQRTAANVTRIGFAAVAEQLGLSLNDDPFPLDVPEKELTRQVRLAAADGLRGLFLMPARVNDEEMRRDERLLAACRAAEVPVVLIERNLRGSHRPLEYDLVGLDDVGGASQLTRHLLTRGRKRVALVVASPISTHDDRVAGYLAALFAGPAKYQPIVLHERSDRPRRSAYARLTDELIAAKADAAVCYNDYTAVGLVMELFARGQNVPRNLAVAGFDDLPIGTQFAIGITTVTLPAKEMARHAVRIMNERIATPTAPPVRVVVPGRLIVRESTGGDLSNGRDRHDR
jgi:LacI family transcriptional regulator